MVIERGHNCVLVRGASRYSDVSLLRKVFIPKGFYFEWFLFRKVVFPKGFYSERFLLQKFGIKPFGIKTIRRNNRSDL